MFPLVSEVSEFSLICIEMSQYIKQSSWKSGYTSKTSDTINPLFDNQWVTMDGFIRDSNTIKRGVDDAVSRLIYFMIGTFSRVQIISDLELDLERFHGCQSSRYWSSIRIINTTISTQLCFVRIIIHQSVFSQCNLGATERVLDRNPSIQWRYSPNRALASSIEVP
jgi:hypothetical protein